MSLIRFRTEQAAHGTSLLFFGTDPLCSVAQGAQNQGHVRFVRQLTAKRAPYQCTCLFTYVRIHCSTSQTRSACPYCLRDLSASILLDVLYVTLYRKHSTVATTSSRSYKNYFSGRGEEAMRDRAMGDGAERVEGSETLWFVLRLICCRNDQLHFRARWMEG